MPTLTPKVNLPHLIGSSKFFSSRYCGLIDETKSFTNPAVNGHASPKESVESMPTEQGFMSLKPDQVPVPNPALQSQPPMFTRELYRPPSINHVMN